ncbi:MAG TPA: prephenate dehydrogenase [Clostridiales bacterium]|nr:prephenate dehydrogenase [Clostridiales bacterium]
MPINSALIIGLGLIGGSLAKALKYKAGLKNIWAMDVRDEYIKAAYDQGVVNCPTSANKGHINQSDVIIICTPVLKTLDTVKEILPHVKPGCIITDVGSTKSVLMDKVAKILPPHVCFIGGHPMAGSENSGYHFSSHHIFENAYYILTPGPNHDNASLDRLRKIIEAIGSIPIIMDAGLHDRVTGLISHLPHILSGGLINLVMATDTQEGHGRKLAAGGFKDITRISSSSPEIWRDICISNKEQLLEIIDLYIKELDTFKTWLKDGQSDKLYRYFDNARRYRNRLASTPTGLIAPYFEIIVDVEDRPGQIGAISTLLGNHGINIKNIGIINSREGEPGCLSISLDSHRQQQKAIQILKANGYKIFTKSNDK